MSFLRASGILLHPTSLPSRFGIGDLGKEAYRFVDFLSGAGQKLWQMLPLCPTGYGNSPYQNLSTFAGNPLLISPEKLVEEGFLQASDLDNLPPFRNNSVDFGVVVQFKTTLLKKSFQMFEEQASPQVRGEYEAFAQRNAPWLEDFALFMALREKHNLALWNTWEPEVKSRQPEALASWRQKLAQEIKRHKFLQYQFFRQWGELKTYCHERNIQLIGDVPIFVALDSAEVWSHPEMFYLDAEGQPTVVGGVPPDYFSKTGQLWGKPLYRWAEMKKGGYGWWLERLKATPYMVDIIRLDHFRGFEKYWEIPAGEKTAINGRWVPGPGADFFLAVKKALGDLPIIAEDLGIITPEVHALRDQFDLPGMRVLQFAFGSASGKDPYRPHNYPRNCVVYTGTHDNNTTIGWFQEKEVTTKGKEAMDKERRRALKYLGTDGREINWDFIRLALMSVANTAIIPLQDVLCLGSEARMNTPGVNGGNWRWRFTPDMLTDAIKERLKELTEIYGRQGGDNENHRR